MATRKESSRLPPGSARVFTVKRAPSPGLCILIENGIACANHVESRGLCNKHLAHLRQHGRLQEFALPKKTSHELRHSFRLKRELAAGICRVIVNGRPCDAPATRRGLCAKHYVAIWQRPDLDLDNFALPARAERKIRLRKVIVDGICRVRENGMNCGETAHARGLCKRHYSWLRENAPGLFDQVATPDPKARRFTLRRSPPEGLCRVAENGRGCPRPAKIRGLCGHHYDVLQQKPDLLEKIALPATRAKEHHLAKKTRADSKPMECVVIENGVPCSRPPEHRGVCRYHRKLIGDHADYSLDDFYLPKPIPVLERKEPEEIKGGLCCVVEDGKPCGTLPRSRGLCRKHYRMATRLGLLDRLALPTRNRWNLHGPGNDRPHLYLDKNILFDYVDAMVFGGSGQAGSVALVERVREGQVRASVSADAIKSTYNHVRHRMIRPAIEGGREAPEEEAESTARQAIERTFYDGGAWRVIFLDAVTFRNTVKAGGDGLSFEDALEWQAYQASRTGTAAPSMFVTRDSHFPEGVHPNLVAREFGWLAGAP